MNRLKARIGMDTPAMVAALLVLCAAPLLGLAVAGQARAVALGTLALLFGAGLMLRPRLAVYVVVVGSIFNNIFVNAGFALLGAGDLAVLVALPVWLLHRMAHPRGLRLPHRWPLLVIFLSLAAASLFLGVTPASGLRSYLREVTYIAGLFAAVDLLRDLRQMERVYVVLALCGAFHAVYGMATWSWTARLGGIPGQPNALGMLLAVCAIPTIGLLLRSRSSWQRALLLGALGVMLTAMLLTISRGTYLAFGFAALWWMRRYRRLVVVGLLAAGGLFAFLSLQSGTVDAIQSRWTLEDSSVSNRLQVQKNALRAIQASPVLGVGFGQFADLHQEVDVTAEAQRGSHNQYLGLTASVGLPAALLLFGFVFAHFRALWRRGGVFARFRADEHWHVAVFQALAIYQSISMAFRPATRQTEWAILALYCALYAIARARQPADGDEAST